MLDSNVLFFSTGRVVIGEGEKDNAPMLFIGEKLGDGSPPQGAHLAPANKYPSSPSLTPSQWTLPWTHSTEHLRARKGDPARLL